MGCVALLLLSGCGVVLGADREAAVARRDLQPVEELPAAGNPLTGQGGPGDRAVTERQRRERAREAKQATTSTTNPDYVEVPLAAVLPGVLPINTELMEEQARAAAEGRPSPPVTQPGNVLWPRAFDPKVSPGQVSESEYCEAVLGVMVAGDSLWKRYNVATGPSRQLLVGAVIEAMKRLRNSASPELSAALTGVIERAEAQFTGINAANAENELLVAELIAAGSGDVGLQAALAPVIVDAGKNCLAPNIESDLKFSSPTPDAIDRWRAGDTERR